MMHTAFQQISRTRVRILPLTIACLSLLLLAKLYDIYEKGNAFSQAMLGRTAFAAGEEEQAATEPKAEDDADADASTNEEKAKKDQQDVKQPGTEAEAKDPASATAETENADDATLVDPADKRTFSDIELDILQSLAERREELDKLEEEIRLKENLLESTEVRLDGKITQIQEMEKTVRQLLAQYDEHEAAKIKSLVKIYENMKPKEAARIFDEMQMPVLLMVIDQMAERRAAPILAQMSPIKARDVTEELAEDRRWRQKQEQELNNLAN